MIRRIVRARFCLFAPLLGLSLVLNSCATGEIGDIGDGASLSYSRSPALASAKNSRSASERLEGDGRKRIYRASQTVEVAEVAASARRIEERVRAGKGFVESSSMRRDRDSHATLTLRVPVSEWRAMMDEFAALGNETNRRITAEDTTVAWSDLEARLKNVEVLRERLRSLLDSTQSVKEILEIEKELARVQSELDAMQARFHLMQSQVRLAKIDLTLKTREIPGPLGAAGKAGWWMIRKLFVLK